MSRAFVLSLICVCAACGLEVHFDDFERNPVLSLGVTIASSEADRRMGLAGKSLSDDEGLLIELPGESDVCIENSQVPFAIDAVFVRFERIVGIERNVAASDPTLRCFRADHIIEVNAGVAVDLAIGDHVRLP